MQEKYIRWEMTPASIGTPLKNRFCIQYIVAQNIQVYFILCCFAQNKDFFSGVLAEVGVSSQTEMKNPIADRTDQQWDLNQKIFTNSFSYLNVFH